MSEKVRLSKLMSQRGLCSRREADTWIERGLVRVDGAVVSVLGTRVAPHSAIRIERQALAEQERLVTVLLNKPVGYVSGQSEGQYPTASVLVTRENQHESGRAGIRYRPQHRLNLAPAGRLDVDSHGLLVLTQDGRIARKLIAPGSGIEKEYLVRIKGLIDEQGLDRLRHGLMLDGRQLKPARITNPKPGLLSIILIEGRKRQVRRMCDLVDLKVTSLKRVRIGNIQLGNLPRGRWRYLNPAESF